MPDALAPDPAPVPETAPTIALEEASAAVLAALRGVIDPELGINLVDLGLVYEVAANDGVAYVTLTTTSPACPIGGYLEDQVRLAVERLPGIESAEIELVHEPRWTPALMTESARRLLGLGA